MKGSVVAILATTMVLFMLVNLKPADAATFTVGDAGGWTFGVNSWPAGKSFSAGDVLVFNYPQGLHNVAVVDAAGYNACDTAGAKILTSGHDQVTLAKGANYFICGVGAHCRANMKMTVNAS
ncbi:unnamed protein product [Linum trigynum]|uniref:Basic blue protein n=1 Tax=Linum trigynum TaxID=586398 RepID=A0AAV2C8X2_9ROSI